MDPCLSNKITKNCELIENSLVRLTKVIDKLIEDGHVTLVDKTEILLAPSKETRINLLLEKLITGGGTSFTAFIEALKTTGNERIADQILQTDSSDDTAVSSFSSRFPSEETTFSTTDSTNCDFREDEILGLYKEKQKYKVQLADMTTSYKQLQSELTIKEHKIESLNKELMKLKGDLEETKRDLDKFGGSDDFEGDMFRRMNTGTNTRELMRKLKDLQLALDAKEDVITGLQKDLDYYKDQLDFVERQLRKQKEECTEKDARIMILRNQVGKLQSYLQASRQSLARLNNDQKRMLEQWSKEQLERFKDIEKKMEVGKVDQSKRFNTLEDKIDILIKMMSGDGVLPSLLKTVDREKNKPATKANANIGRKGKTNRYKN